MEAKELRIGNYIHPLLDENEVAKVCYIGENDFGYERISDEEYFQGNSIKQIPLTEEWLLMLGANNTFYNNYLDFEYFEIYESNGIWYVEKEGVILCELKYVHQLQNLYFALTNDELITK